MTRTPTVLTTDGYNAYPYEFFAVALTLIKLLNAKLLDSSGSKFSTVHTARFGELGSEPVLAFRINWRIKLYLSNKGS